MSNADAIKEAIQKVWQLHDMLYESGRRSEADDVRATARLLEDAHYNVFMAMGHDGHCGPKSRS